jgi:RNA-binding protein Musashi
MSSLQQSNSVETGGEGLDDIFLTNRIFIGNLASELEEFTIYKYCSAYGEIVKCQIMKEPKTGLSRGFGFITYAQASSAQAILNARPHYIGHHKINVKSAFPTGEVISFFQIISKIINFRH